MLEHGSGAVSATRVVVFDLFGTLVPTYSVRDNDRAVERMGAILGCPSDGIWHWYARHWNECATGAFPSVEAIVRQICTALGTTADPAGVWEVVALRLEFTRRSLVAAPVTISTLQQLRSCGYKVALVTNCAAETPAVWEATKLAPLVDAAVFSCAAGLKKPDPRIYQRASEMLGVNPAECLYVGDGSDRELSGAQQAGMRAVLLRVPLDDAYDSQRADVEAWTGPSIAALEEILPLLGRQ